MALRGRLKRVEKAARGNVESFELLDGTQFHFDVQACAREIFRHWYECLGSRAQDWPEPPEIYRKALEAKDVERAVLMIDACMGSFSFAVYDRDVLLQERRLKPRGLVARRDPATGEWSPVDPYSEEHEAKDLSE